MFGVIRNVTVAIVVAVVAISAVPASADAQSAIDARRALMKTNGKNMGVVARFVKKNQGTSADVARSARIIASNLAQFANHFPKGTAQGTGAGNTRAKSEIWANWAKFAGSTAKGTELALALSTAAETGDKGAIGEAMGALGKGCGGCHKAWRGPKNK